MSMTSEVRLGRGLERSTGSPGIKLREILAISKPYGILNHLEAGVRDH